MLTYLKKSKNRLRVNNRPRGILRFPRLNDKNRSNKFRDRLNANAGMIDFVCYAISAIFTLFSYGYAMWVQLNSTAFQLNLR